MDVLASLQHPELRVGYGRVNETDNWPLAFDRVSNLLLNESRVGRGGRQ